MWIPNWHCTQNISSRARKKRRRRRKYDSDLPLISATVLQQRENKINTISHFISFKTIQHSVSQSLEQLCIMGGGVWNYLGRIQMRSLFYCVLWYNKFFIATGGLIFISMYLVLPASERESESRGNGDWPCSAAALSVASEWVDPEGFLMKRRRRLKSSSQ